MKRLTASTYRLIFTKPSMSLKGFADKYGNFYELNARLVNVNQIFYSIVRHLPYETISLYDGTDYNEAFDFFCELMLALRGVSEAESFNKTKQMLEKKTLQLKPKRQSINLQYGINSLGDSEQLYR